MERFFNKLNCWLFGVHIFSQWECKSAHNDAEGYFWYERKCVYCPQIEQKEFR